MIDYYLFNYQLIKLETLNDLSFTHKMILIALWFINAMWD